MNLPRSTLIAATVSLALPGGGGAEEPALIAAVRAAYDVSKGLELVFNLETWWAAREKMQKREGRVVLAAGDRFRAEIGKTVWVCDGRTYWQYSETTKQVVIKSLLDVDLSMHPSQVIKNYLTGPAFTLSGEDDKEAMFAAKRVNGESGRDEGSVTLWIDKKKAQVTKLVSVDRQGNRNTYTFTKTRLGIGSDPALFTMAVPGGVEVLDTRD